MNLRFPIGENNKLSGILRHAIGLDQALDKKTEVTSLITNRRQSRQDFDAWHVADFQIGYDACQCQIPTKMVLEFTYNEELQLDLEFRSISLEKDINKLSEYEKNFLQFQKSDPSTNAVNEPANVIYKSLNGMLEDYNKALSKYNDDLRDYNTTSNLLNKEIVDLIIAASSGYAVSLAVGPLYKQIEENKLGTEILKEFSKQLTSSGKKILADEFDFLNVGFDLKKDKPTRPQVPVATFTEGRIIGTLGKEGVTTSTDLYLPGTMPTAQPNPQFITSRNFPAYNNVLGLFSLLNTPKIQIHTKFGENG